MLFKTKNKLWIWIIRILFLIILISIFVISFTLGTSTTSLNRFVRCTLCINRRIAHTSRIASLPRMVESIFLQLKSKTKTKRTRAPLNMKNKVQGDRYQQGYYFKAILLNFDLGIAWKGTVTDYVKVEGKIIIKDVIVSNFKVALS